MKNARCAAAAILLACVFDGAAVSLNAEGLGQALIYPYYTVNSSDGNPFNTYLSVVNHTGDAKALRVRFREGRLGKETLSFNLFLGPNDVWTGALVPLAGGGARLLSLDFSCTDPGFNVDFAGSSVSFVDLRTESFTGVNADGAGTAAERVREGFVEVIEMATLTGASAAAVTANSAGASDCNAVRNGAAPSVLGPRGGLSGTLTLINVASGMDFTVNAEALADLASAPFYRGPADSYPGFTAMEIDAVSLVIANGNAYRSTWSRPVDAVSAVLMRDRWIAEYVLDSNSRGLTDVVATFPTRHFHARAGAVTAPFSRAATWSAACTATDGETFGLFDFNREEGANTASGCDFLCPPSAASNICASAAVGAVRNGAAHMPSNIEVSTVVGSTTRGMGVNGMLAVSPTFQNGWLRLSSPSSVPLSSLPSSVRIDLATGQQTAGAHQYTGLPVIGLWLRTLRNGNLGCGSGVCQGNYGSAYSMRYRVGVSP